MHSTCPSPTRPTLGDELERHRLEHRARRLERVLDALRSRALTRSHRGTAPPPMCESIADFSDELARVRRRLVDLRAA